MIQPVIPHRSVVTLNVGVLLRVTQLDKHKLNTFIYSPGGQQTTDVFWAIITAYPLRLAAPFNDLI
jgi:hypothetical protein